MRIYDQIAKLKTFTLSDVTDITGNVNTSASLIGRLLKKNYIIRIRKDLYTSIDLTTGNIVANKYQIASAINENAFISHHTAFEFYGLANQVYNTVYVSSKKRFNTFIFKETTYKHVESSFDEGVFQVKNIEGIRIAEIERALVDSIQHVGKIGGFEELIKTIEMLEELDELKLLQYMKKYHNNFLYQKTGFIFERYYKGEGISASFYERCRIESRDSVRYLVPNHSGKFQASWNLIVPEEYLARNDEEVGPNEYI